jgi:HD-GYP domain-containing protein (c-di-GMP phosphodiesterase class II)
VLHPPADAWILFEVGALVPLGWLCSSRKVYLTESNAMKMGTVAQIVTVILLPLQLAVLAATVAKALSVMISPLIDGRRPRMRAALLNVSKQPVATFGGAALFQALSGTHYLWVQGSWLPIKALPALAALGAVDYVANALLVGGAITLSTREGLGSVFQQITRDTLLPELSLITVGIVFAVLWHFSPILSLFVVVPVVLSVRSFEAVARLRDQTEKAVMQMAKSVDMRDTGTGIHSQQLEQAAQRLARALGLTPEHVHEVGLAARAHDLGKIEISDAILLKRGPLSPEERAVMEEHPVIGANMLASYSAFGKSIEFVKHHHERWDGRGYPDGLKGEDIPLGSRIITVVDSYDAMTSDRPYRQALGVAEAVDRLKAGMGTQFDPRACATWIQLLIEDGSYVPQEAPPHLHLVREEAS